MSKSSGTWAGGASKEQQREYNKTEASKERYRRYNASRRGLNRRKRHYGTEKWEATEQRYWARRASSNVIGLESHRTDIIDLQMMLGRQLTSEELDWWAIVHWCHADGFLKLKEAA